MKILKVVIKEEGLGKSRDLADIRNDIKRHDNAILGLDAKLEALEKRLDEKMSPPRQPNTSTKTRVARRTGANCGHFRRWEAEGPPAWGASPATVTSQLDAAAGTTREACAIGSTSGCVQCRRRGELQARRGIPYLPRDLEVCPRSVRETVVAPIA